MPAVKITGIDTLQVRIPLDTWAPPPMFAGRPRTHVEGLYVRVTTDKGVTGWGESFGSSGTTVIAAFDNWIRHLAVGQDPADTALVPRIERLLHGLGRAGPVMHALSGLDIALWDIRGKLEGVSVSKLLDGPRRKRVETYASLLQYSGNVEDVKRNTERALKLGYRHIKLHERTPEAVAAARAVTGPDIPIKVDTNCAWLPGEANAPVLGMKPSKPYWVEEPIWPPEDFESAARLRKATGVPIAMGENATSPSDFRKMIAAGAVDYVQPSIVKIGGITQFMRIAGESETAGVTCVPHAFFFGPGYLATLHCIACKERDAPLERLFADVAHVTYAKTVPDVNGAVEVPDRPGLGADPEDELFAKYKV
ncbi:MAG: mandelate racemase/muconate lactonizing enzyme family protein [Alphaproteobacteria bacterium]|nr:mandelate racemase/muconate lactonizing enzyme family protein [Alphaproteobacteria bacterium]